MSRNMPDELTLEPEIEQGWEATGELIPQGMRRAFSFNVFGSKFLDRLCHITTRRLKFFYDIFKDRLYWTDVSAEDMLYVPEVAGVERPPQDGTVRGQVGKLLRKLPPVEEPVYFVARAKFSYGAVRLWLTAEGNTSGNAVLAVGLAESLDGPWTYYYGSSPWTFDPTQPIQAYDIATTNLEVGKLYYYRVVRPKEAPGDTLNASVLLAKVQVR
jgi:hypothetical protein